MPVKPTRDEFEARVQKTVSMILAQWKKHEIKKTLMGLYNVKARTCEVYLSRARAQIRATSQGSTLIEKLDHYVALKAIMMDEKSSVRERILAAKELRRTLQPMM
ncbi:hypothetical protein SH668x_001214 [Planctomicrobium sp. SH668]|uniref:hypothetical protein n=1 Tax=Planctomicrobium sp. SH668 TaxID=3448126 RepID=UPI003F5B9AF8